VSVSCNQLKQSVLRVSGVTTYYGDMAGEKKTDPRGPNKAEPQTKAKPAPSGVPGSKKKK
jgi:hypothetical protein